LPPVSAEAVLEPLHPSEQLQGIDKVLDVLMPVRMGDYQLVIVAVSLAPDLVIEPGTLALEEPEHSSCVSV